MKESYGIHIEICISPHHFFISQSVDDAFLFDPTKGIYKMREDVKKYFREALPKYRFLPSENPYLIDLGVNI